MNMRHQDINHPGENKTGVFTRKNLKTGASSTVYALRKLKCNNIIELEDDGCDESFNPGQARQRLLRMISTKIEINGKLYPKVVADDDSLGAVTSSGGYPITIPVMTASMIDAIGMVKRKNQDLRVQVEAEKAQKESFIEEKAKPKRGRPRKKKVDE